MTLCVAVEDVKLDLGFGPQPFLSIDRPAPGPVLGPRRPFWELMPQHVQRDTQQRNERYLLLILLSRRTFISTVTTVMSSTFAAISPLTTNSYAMLN